MLFAIILGMRKNSDKPFTPLEKGANEIKDFNGGMDNISLVYYPLELIHKDF